MHMQTRPNKDGKICSFPRQKFQLPIFKNWSKSHSELDSSGIQVDLNKAELLLSLSHTVF